MNLETLLEMLSNLTPHDRSLIERAYTKAEKHHEGQFRKSGEPYFTHCVAVAYILAEMKLDAEVIAAALMHDLIEDTTVTYDDIKAEFSENIAKLVEGVTKLTNLPLRVNKQEGDKAKEQRELEYFRKMLLMMGDDVRVVLIKLADRLHNMRTLGYMKPEKQQIKAQETLEIFAPLANRLGIWQMKWELEDLAFRYLDPDAYHMLAKKLDERRADRESYLERVVGRLREDLEANGIHNPTITGRPKHLYGIYRKMQRKDVQFQEIYDVRAVRVIVDNNIQCYQVLGIVHNLWRPIPGEFDDYIAAPKDNFYQSLHTAVLDDEGKTVEVQIRTWGMHEHAEYGVAAHWRYKEGKGQDEEFDKRISFLRRLMEFGLDQESNASEFLENFKTQVFENRIYVFTPKGDIVDLPSGATPIDFAYHVHTEIGHRCRGAKVRGKLVSLNYPLRTGDQIEIQVEKRGGPSLDWLNPELGYVKTHRAESKIRQWFRKQNREKNIANGRAVLEQTIKRFNESLSMEAVAHLFDFEKLEDFLAAIGAGDIHTAQISGRILEQERRIQQEKRQETLTTTTQTFRRVNNGTAGSIQVQGAGGFLVSMAKCCNPIEGDEIIGYITRGRGVTVHRTDCPNMVNSTEPERLTEVAWSRDQTLECYSVPIEVVAYDRSGLMRDISTTIADEHISMSYVNVATESEIATFQVTLELENIYKLSRILGKLLCIPNVVDARRRSSG
ncbi:MAG: RelA/SpoT family protein [Phototrophicaceae bacterium]